MRKCIESLLVGGDRVEIVIVNDGSSDDTARIADEYASAYPEIVKAVHQENKGHGGAINSALSVATGRYFKVVDSDDWLAPKAYAKFMDALDRFNSENHYPDLVIANYVYDKVGVKNKRRMKFDNCFPVEKYFGWDEFGHTNPHQYLLMHAVFYRTDILIKSGVVLPEHMFYVDNIFVFVPMPYVKEMYYINCDLYRYFIGREDQSVNEKIMIKRIDQQLFVTRALIDAYTSNCPKQMALYMRKYVGIMMVVSSSLCIVSREKELLKKKKELWQYLKEHNRRLYGQLMRSKYGLAVSIPTPLGREITIWGYHVAHKIYGFN